MEARNELLSQFAERGIRPSIQRIKVMEHLRSRTDHPTADQITLGLRDEIPTLSKSTVYNTLHLLADAGLLQVISTDDAEAHYDAGVHPHGHFKCTSCSAITDFQVDVEGLHYEGLDGYVIKSRDVFFRGICPKCQARKN